MGGGVCFLDLKSVLYQSRRDHAHTWMDRILPSIGYLLTYSLITSPFYLILNKYILHPSSFCDCDPIHFTYPRYPFMIIIIHSFTGWLRRATHGHLGLVHICCCYVSAHSVIHTLFFCFGLFCSSDIFFFLHGTVTVIATIVYILIVIWLAGFLFVIPEHFQRRVCCDVTSTYCTFHPSSLCRDEIARIFLSIIPSELAGYCE